MSFTNLYYKRTTGTAKACYVCYKPTTTCLATINAVDFLYSCDGHLTDPGFATPVGEAGDGAEGARKLGLTAEEIAKVKEEWEERQKKKAEKEKEKAKDDKDKEKTQEKEAKKKEKPTPTPEPEPTKPAHQRYTLHRDFFAMRLEEHRRRRQTLQAKALAPRLPSVP